MDLGRLFFFSRSEHIMISPAVARMKIQVKLHMKCRHLGQLIYQDKVPKQPKHTDSRLRGVDTSRIRTLQSSPKSDRTVRSAIILCTCIWHMRKHYTRFCPNKATWTSNNSMWRDDTIDPVRFLECNHCWRKGWLVYNLLQACASSSFHIRFHIKSQNWSLVTNSSHNDM